MPVPVLVAKTEAPGNTAPVESFTRPTIAPADCAITGVLHTPATDVSKRTARMRAAVSANEPHRLFLTVPELGRDEAGASSRIESAPVRFASPRYRRNS